jgi:hypothetical protein
MEIVPNDLLFQYNIDTSSKLSSYMSSDYLKDENKFGSYDFSLFFSDLGLYVDFDTRKEGELLVRYFLAAVASYILDGDPVDYILCVKFARERTDAMMDKLGLERKIPEYDLNGKKIPLKTRAIDLYNSNLGMTNQELIELFKKKLAMNPSSAVVYASNVQHKWKD